MSETITKLRYYIKVGDLFVKKGSNKLNDEISLTKNIEHALKISFYDDIFEIEEVNSMNNYKHYLTDYVKVLDCLGIADIEIIEEKTITNTSKSSMDLNVAMEQINEMIETCREKLKNNEGFDDE